jgi:glycine/serine hydroxymethyltransferase
MFPETIAGSDPGLEGALEGERRRPEEHIELILIGHVLRGNEADAARGRANITVNKNAVPDDPRSPMVTSGLRMGTPAATTRRFGVREIEQIVDLIAEILDVHGRRRRSGACAPGCLDAARAATLAARSGACATGCSSSAGASRCTGRE